MNEELKAAIEWARAQAESGFCLNKYQGFFNLLADAAERSVDPPTMEITAEHPAITPEILAALVPDWAAGTCYDPLSRQWIVAERKPHNPGNHSWVWGEGNSFSRIHLDLPAPADWRESWHAKPKPELRCPWPGCDGRLFANTDDRTWWMQCDTCKCPGPIRANEAAARASAEAKR